MEGILRCIFQLSVGNKLSLGPLSLLQENRANVCYAWDQSRQAMRRRVTGRTGLDTRARDNLMRASAIPTHPFTAIGMERVLHSQCTSPRR